MDGYVYEDFLTKTTQHQVLYLWPKENHCKQNTIQVSDLWLNLPSSKSSLLQMWQRVSKA